MRVPLAVIVTLSMSGCLVGPKYVRPPLEPPPGFKSPATPTGGGTAALTSEWWRLYRDDELARLMASANAANQTVRQAMAAVDQARALARVAASYRYPTVLLDAAYTRQRLSANRVSSVIGQVVGAGITYNDWLVPVDLSYELDVWGRVRRSIDSQRALAIAAQEDEAVIRLAVQTDVAQDYYTLRGLDAQAAILTATVASYREQVRILSVQVNTGLASPVPLNQAQALLQTTLAQLADVGRARDDEEHALAILCGQAAPLFSVEANPLRDLIPPSIPAGLPATVLSRRPDVAAAERKLVAANAQVGGAIASLYPTFALSGAAGFESGRLSSLFNWQSALWSLAESVTVPIFEGGRLRANVDAARAQYRQFVAAYLNQVLTAYADVEDALTDLHALSDQVANLRDAVTASEKYLRVAQVQFRNGLVDYLTVIDAERTLLADQLALAQARTMQMTASAHLIKALGGGWEDRGA
jgi:multidrug efflux system outer membrane protein